MKLLYFYQHLPQYINPIAFTVGSFSVRWYAIMFLLGFIVAYAVLMFRIKKGEIISGSQKSEVKSQNEPRTTNYELRTIVLDFLLAAFFSSLIGGRLGYVLFYNPPYFLAHPLAIISPYDPASGQFTGIYGMSYHGALLGVLLVSYVFVRMKKINFWQWADFVAPAAALGYFFGRIGNFLNDELYGRITTSPLGMYFANDPSVLRHPSQIYEAILEGLVLFAVLWKMRKAKLAEGSLFATYLVGYGILRIFAEQFRQPDPQVGFLLGDFTLGQLLSFGMIIFGICIWVLKKQKK
jgi:phosphatidylglycerol---prolipoprotein diacylglyceryl transferase